MWAPWHLSNEHYRLMSCQIRVRLCGLNARLMRDGRDTAVLRHPCEAGSRSWTPDRSRGDESQSRQSNRNLGIRYEYEFGSQHMCHLAHCPVRCFQRLGVALPQQVRSLAHPAEMQALRQAACHARGFQPFVDPVHTVISHLTTLPVSGSTEARPTGTRLCSICSRCTALNPRTQSRL